MPLHGKSLVAGHLVAEGGARFRAINPATGEALLPEFHEGRPADVEAALAEASAAFQDYRARPAETRAQLLEAIAAEFEALGDGLIERARLETGLGLPRLQGERVRTCNQLRLFAQVVREGSWIDARIDLPSPAGQTPVRPDLRRMLIPLGPVAVFGASNFPFAFSVAGGDTASAFAAGCPVVVKAHPAHPGTSELVGGAVARAVAACGLPAGLFSLVHGGPAIGLALVRHPAVAAVGFTGSQAAGRALCEAAAARPHPIPVFAEMSSLNPVFLLPGAIAERAAAIATGLIGSVTLGAGQFCTKPGLVFVQRSPDADAFLAWLAQAAGPAANATMLTPGIRDAFLKVEGRILGAPGVDVLTGGSAEANGARNEGRLMIARTTAANLRRHPDLATEAFGPFTLLVLCDDADDFAACARGLEGQLTATLHGNAADLAGAGGLIALLEQKAGRLIINGFPTGVEVAPAMHHGGPYPATSDPHYTSVGTAAILRFARPVCYQGFPEELLPTALHRSNPLGLLRQINGSATRDAAAP
jgi:NADP-dependent aldehyde dehydrogenase